MLIKLICVCNINISHISKAMNHSEFSSKEITVLFSYKTVPHVVLRMHNQRYEDGKLPTGYVYERWRFLLH
jgi:hypothetical protein